MHSFNQVFDIDVTRTPTDDLKGSERPVEDLFRDLHVLDGSKDLHATTKFLNDQAGNFFLVGFTELA